MTLSPLLTVFYFFINLASASEASLRAFLRTEDAWVRATEIGNSAAYVKIINDGFESDRLIDAFTDVCKTVELHTHLKEGDVYKMRPVEAINLPASQAIELKEGGLHIMLLNLLKPLKENDKIKLVLLFEKAGEISILAEVRKSKRECNCEE